MVPLERFMLNLLGQSGDRYVFGAEANLLDPDPDVFDCSELIQWAGARSGVIPAIPDGSSAQWDHVRLRGQRIAVEVGVKTRGALLWHPGHVAIACGNGLTIEARGHLWGVGQWAAAGRFQGAGLFPGIDYQNHAPAVKEEDELTPDEHRWLKELHDQYGTKAGATEGTGRFMLQDIHTRITTLGNRVVKLLDHFKIDHS